VSELSAEGAIVVQGGGSIPGIKTRRAETTVEIPSGGTLAMAGMIQEQTKQDINGIPGIMQVPVLGTLFRSRDFVNRQTELAVLVTPYVVRATAAKNLSRPDDGFADASDPATVLLGKSIGSTACLAGPLLTPPIPASSVSFSTDTPRTETVK
jgi:pilus assembly protein CpaC